MNIKSLINKLFKTTDELHTNIINLNDVIQIPDRDTYQDNLDIISLIDKYKEEYLSTLSAKRYLLSDELSSKESDYEFISIK